MKRKNLLSLRQGEGQGKRENMEDLKKQAEEFFRLAEIKEFLSDPLKRDYVILAAGGAVLLLAVLFAVIPGLRAFGDRGVTAEKRQLEISVARREISRIDELERRRDELSGEYDEFIARVPGERETEEFLNGLASIAGDFDVQLLSVVPAAPVERTGSEPWERYSYRHVPISVKGGYHDVTRFIDSLQKARSFTSIRDIRVQHDPRNPRRHDVNIVLNVYMLSGER